MSNLFLTHQPILSKQGRLIANRLLLHVPIGTVDAMSEVTDALQHIEEYWPIGQQAAIFLGIKGAPLDAGLFDWMLPENATLEIAATDIVPPAGSELIQAIRNEAPSTCLNFDLRATGSLQSGLNFRFVGLDALTLTPVQMQAIALKIKAIAPLAIAFNVNSMPAYKACMETGMAGASGWFCKLINTVQAKELAPGQAHIIRLLNLVRNNADISQIESSLKQDVALSYRLLRYINSAGFGLSCEVQSFRHAVTILGYDKLNKWLSLLLVSSSTDPMAPAMMHAALVRARLMELLGQGLVSKSELDNLFIAGAFSMLDVMLGVSLEKALEPMHLPAEIAEALITRTGQYAPFYEMAIAAEDGDAEKLQDTAESLGLNAHQVNSALLQALSFSANLSA